MEIVDLFPKGSPFAEFETELRHLAESDAEFEATAGRMMLDLIDRLRRGTVGPTLFVSPFHSRGELLVLHYVHSPGHRTTIRIAIDYYDRSALVDGLPRLHYRIRYGPNDEIPSESMELRSHDIQIASDFIYEAIRAC